MRKELLNVKKSKLSSEKPEEKDNEILHIATEPPETRITIPLVGGGRLTTNEHYPQRERVHKITARVKRADDLSTTYKRGETVWYKANPEAEPEILAYKDLAIWNYNEFLTDVVLEKIPYRIFYNPISKKILVNEIVSYDYNGIILLKNPVNKELTLKITKMLFDKGKPNEYRETINAVKRELEKVLIKNKQKKSVKKPGRKPEVNLMRATLYCIKKYDNKIVKEYRPYIERAYALYKIDGQTHETFITRVYSKWAKLRKSYSQLEKQIRNSKTLYQHAKEVLKIPRTNSKEKI